MKRLSSLGVILLSATLLVACSSNSSSSSGAKEDVKTVQSSKPSEVKKEEPKVPMEHKNALKSAENYIATMPFSKARLYDQLTSDAGSKFPADAAQYAIDNIKVDWNKQALKSAKNYMKISPMSTEQLREQLTSEAGEKYTPEEAQYAIDNLDK
ncbi:phage super infection exclusion [Streptococcus pseudoporcinus]|uniref:Phage super infection exclusion n=2 Tax=Streptococcus TaxID=1301 RepID=A0A4U9Y0W6_9STRE|nr:MULTISPECIES: Ltp family lipoprotein [Streptococcus]MBA2796599.1 Ltp family lipoprotein [Streptococcus porcinus]VTS13413.1 phage super infection exclusion [Streptococcus pseudoporcinus]VTS19268.1 phage super infection exclusion [Streptococcus pseudoporcinus]VTS32262.1 phage super infection exclusion [Streptococcus pseudoporcinus]